jgi:hypothetical protein
MTEKLDQSVKSHNTIDLNESESKLNYSSFSIISTNTIKRKNVYNLKENLKFDEDSNSKFQIFLNSYSPIKNILFFLDSKNNVWELVKRTDLNHFNIYENVDNIRSIAGIKENLSVTNRSRFLCITPKSKSFCIDADDSPKSKLLNIKIKNNDISFNSQSELDISRINDLNFSNFIRDINNE